MKRFVAISTIAGCLLALLTVTAAESDFLDVDIEDAFRPCLTARKNTIRTTGVKEFRTPEKGMNFIWPSGRSSEGKHAEIG